LADEVALVFGRAKLLHTSNIRPYMIGLVLFPYSLETTRFTARVVAHNFKKVRIMGPEN
jgi:hypothetical protein